MIVLTVRDFLRRNRITGTLLALRGLAKSGQLRDCGWFESYRTLNAIDGAGNEIPWYTYPAIRFLYDRVTPGMTVFEYGSGNSTLWWSRRVGRLVTCEHDAQWYDAVAPRLPRHVEYHLVQMGDDKYASHIAQFREVFDIVVIDGRERVRCAMSCIPALTSRGVVVWDNSDRIEYEEGFAHLSRGGFRRLDFWGMGPINTYEWCTSVFYRPDNCVAI